MKLLFGLFAYTVCGLVFWTFLCTVRLGTRARALSLMALLLCASKFTCFAAFGGDAFVPELPEGLIGFWNWACCGLILLLPITLVGLAIRWFVRRRWQRDCPRAVWLAVLPVLAWGFALLGWYNSRRLPEVREITLVCPGLPAELDGYRILQISDLHACSAARAWRTEAIVELANAQAADLICLTGDLADGWSKRQFRHVRPLRGLQARDGVLVVSGNHEFYFDPWGWRSRYRTLENLRFLENDWVEPRPGLVVAGVGDPAGVAAGFAIPDPDRAFKGAPEHAYRILLQHRPCVDYAALYGRTPTSRWDLQLSGHTHGGIAPGLGAIVRLANGGKDEGLYADVRRAGDALYVSSGVGQWSGFPMRFFSDATITVFTLRAQP